MKIVPIRKKDRKECAEIIFEEFNKQGEGFTKKTALQRVNNTCQPGFSFCMKGNKEIIGLILATTFPYAKGKYLWIEELVVRGKWQGKGIGEKLMKRAEKEAKKKNIDVITLMTKSFNTKFYKRLGFNETDYTMVEKEL